MAENSSNKSLSLENLDPSTLRDLEFEVVNMRANYPKQLEKSRRSVLQEHIAGLEKYQGNSPKITKINSNSEIKCCLSDCNATSSFENMEADIEAFQELQKKCKSLQGWLESKAGM